MYGRLVVCFFLLCIFARLSVYAGGGWTHKKGRGFFKIEGRSITGRSLLNDAGEPEELVPTVYLGFFSLYGAYGLRDDLDVVFNLPFVYNQVSGIPSGLRKETQRTRTPKLGDTSVGLQYALLRDQPFVLSASLAVGFPTGMNDDDPFDYLQTGTGVWREGVGLHFGYATGETWYVKGGFHYNNRSGGYSTTLGGDLGGGYFLMSRRLLLAASVWSVLSLRDGDYENPEQRYTVYANNTEYVAFGISASYYLMPEVLGFSVGLDGAFMGRNILGAPSLHAAVFYNL